MEGSANPRNLSSSASVRKDLKVPDAKIGKVIGVFQYFIKLKKIRVPKINAPYLSMYYLVWHGIRGYYLSLLWVCSSLILTIEWDIKCFA